MSDVSGIPYMGPMGQGNFFAPQFSYNPQINPTAGYAGPSAYGQAVLGGVLQDTQRSQQHSADLITSAAMAMPNSPGGAYMFSDTGGPAGGWGGNAFNQGAMNNFALNGGGYSFPSIPDYSGGGGFRTLPSYDYPGGGGTSPINWNTLFSGGGGGSGGLGSSGFDLGNAQSWAGNWNTPQSGGMSMPGGLNSPMSGSGLDWSGLFGGGGARADPYPNMTMPDGLNSPMTAPQQPYTSGIAPDETGGQTFPQQQQPIDFSSLFGQGVGGTGGAPQQPPYTSGIAPDETGGRSFGERFDALGGSAPMGDSAPQSTEPAALPETSRMSDALLGYTPQQWPESAYDKPSDPLMDRPLPGNPYTDPQGGGLTATDMSEQARARLAELMVKPTIELSVDPAVAKDAGLPTGSEVPLPQDRPEGADAPPATPPYPLPPAETPAPLPEGAARPPANVPFTVEKGKEAAIRAVQPRLSAAVQGGATFLPPGYTVEAYSGARNGPGQAYHRGGNAMDVRIIGPDGPIPSEGADSTGMYTLLARGVKTWTQQNDPQLAGQLGWGGAFGTQRGSSGGANIIPDLMHFDLGGSRGALRPEVQFGKLQPLSEAERNAMPANIPLLGDNQVPLDVPGAGPMGASSAIPLPQERPAEAPQEQRPGVNLGQNITPPPMDIPDPRVSGGGFNALDAAANAPVKHSGLELARANIDTPIEKIAMERGGQKAVDQINFMAMGKSPRQLAEQYGGMFMDRAEPLFKSLGITRQDFDKAAAMSPTKQDIKMRFGEGGFGPYPDYTGPEAAPGGGYPDFRQSADVEDRRAELANLQAGGFEYPAGPEVAPTPLSGALGLGDLPPVAEDATFNERFNALDAATSEPVGSGLDPSNPLIAQRSGYADTIRDDPNKSLQLAARLYSEEQNNPATRQAILEAMLNRLKATGQDPLNLGYYPKNTEQYNDALAKLSNDNALLNQIYQEMEGPFGGSNMSNYATDWASSKLANTMRAYATPTWTSPSNEQFFRKDFSTNTGSKYDTGPGDAAKNQRWYESVSSPFPR